MFLSFYYIECELFAVFIKILFENWRHFCRPSVIHAPVKCSRGHLKCILAWKGVIWTAIVKKVKCLGGVAGGDDVEASIWPIHNGMGYIFFLVEMLQVSLIFVSFSLTLFMFPKPVYKTSKPQHIYWQNGRCWYIRCF